MEVRHPLGGGGVHVTLEKGGLLRVVVCLLLGMQHLTFKFKKINKYKRTLNLLGMNETKF